eukprot:6793531-Pyramimonas_sp.AAC.1
MPVTSAKEHLFIVICGHVDTGKSTTADRLHYDLGCLPDLEVEQLQKEAESLAKGSIAFAFYMDRQKKEQEC